MRAQIIVQSSCFADLGFYAFFNCGEKELRVGKKLNALKSMPVIDLVDGVLEVEKELGGASQVRGRYQPGDFYGEIPILLDSPTIASLRAHERPPFFGSTEVYSKRSSIPLRKQAT
jgi:hypothetical protein